MRLLKAAAWLYTIATLAAMGWALLDLAYSNLHLALMLAPATEPVSLLGGAFGSALCPLVVTNAVGVVLLWLALRGRRELPPQQTQQQPAPPATP